MCHATKMPFNEKTFVNIMNVNITNFESSVNAQWKPCSPFGKVRNFSTFDRPRIYHAPLLPYQEMFQNFYPWKLKSRKFLNRSNIFVLSFGFLMNLEQLYSPNANSINDLWRHWWLAWQQMAKAKLANPFLVQSLDNRIRSKMESRNEITTRATSTKYDELGPDVAFDAFSNSLIPT